MIKQFVGWIVFVSLTLWMLVICAGCAGTKKSVDITPLTVEQMVATEVPAYVQTPGTEVTTITTESYTVVKHDCLWNIAGKEYQDSFKWPLIQKANQTIIHDPDLIYPKQVFVIERGQDEATVALARLTAINRPKYRKHHKSRK
jgi:hypothetical protein